MITTATKITLVRLCLVPVFIVTALIDFPYHFLIAGLVYSIVAITDFLDGFIARHTGTVSKLGKILDPIADKMLSISALLILACLKLFYHTVAPIVLVAIMMTRELLISAMRAIVLRQGLVLAADILGKLKTIFINVCVPVTLLSASLNAEFGYDNFSYPFFRGIGTAMFFLGFLFTIISAVRYFYINRKVIKQAFQSLKHCEEETSGKKVDDVCEHNTEIGVVKNSEVNNSETSEVKDEG